MMRRQSLAPRGPAPTADPPTLTRWQLRRRERKEAHRRLMGFLFIVLAAAVAAFFVLLVQVISPAFAG